MGPFYILLALYFFFPFFFPLVGLFKRKLCLKHPGNGGVFGANNMVKNFPGLWWGGSSVNCSPNSFHVPSETINVFKEYLLTTFSLIFAKLI